MWTFQYAAGFRGPGILIKRSTIVDLSVYAAWLRGPDISQNIHKIFKKHPKIDYRAFASSRRHYAADNRTARDIQNFGPFWVVKIQGGQWPPGPPDKKYPCYTHHAEVSLREVRQYHPPFGGYNQMRELHRLADTRSSVHDQPMVTLVAETDTTPLRTIQGPSSESL